MHKANCVLFETMWEPLVAVSVNSACAKLDKIKENVESTQNDWISENDREALLEKLNNTGQKEFNPFTPVQICLHFVKCD